MLKPNMACNVSDTFAARCMQAFPLYPIMSVLNKGSVQADPSSSLDQAELLHADTSPMHQVSSWL